MKLRTRNAEDSVSRSEVLDESENDDTTPVVRYEITSYGADYDIAGLVGRLKKEDIIIPPFQRDYVWRLPEASRFVESILLGLPVPGVFLAKDPSNKLLVIDGQQRLKTLEFFFGGYFNPKPDEKTRKIFKLAKVASRFHGLTYQELAEPDRRHLDDYVIHATIVKQDSPANDDTSIYHIFERLNTTGQRLTPQEIRTAVYHGLLLALLELLNENKKWRTLFGKPNPRLKDRELILRFFAFFSDAQSYKRPLAEFLNKFAAKNRNAKPNQLEKLRESFCRTVEILCDTLGTEAFRPVRALNAAVFDSVMVGIAKRLGKGNITQLDQVKTAYEKLLLNKAFLAAISHSTSDEDVVETRMKLALEAFANVK